MFLVLARIREPQVGNCGNAHFGSLRRRNARKRVLDDKTRTSGDAEFVCREQVDIWSRLSALYFVASDDDIEKRRESVAI